MVENFLGSPGNGAVVDMDGEDNNSPSHPGIEDSMVIVSVLEAQLDECLV